VTRLVSVASVSGGYITISANSSSTSMLGLSSAVSISVYDSRNSTIRETTTATFTYNKACVLTDLAVSSITTSSGNALSDQTYRV
jgi:hypothetical protein